jgi:3-oxoacyl-[acyl-carrier protein] reductase
MNLDLQGKVAWIGGASKGLGRACAESLAAEGAKVILTARNQGDLDEAVNALRKKGCEAVGIVADLGSPKAVESTISNALVAFGGIDIAVINSGGPKVGKFMDLSSLDWQEGYYRTLGYVTDVCRIIIPSMVDNKWGRIITITSIVATEPASTLALSSVFRVGVLNLVKLLSQDFARENITVNNISPGAFKTDRAIQLMQDRSARTGETLSHIENEIIKNLPMGRYQVPEECGAVAAFLASKRASGITGMDIRVDGGISKSI